MLVSRIISKIGDDFFMQVHIWHALDSFSAVRGKVPEDFIGNQSIWRIPTYWVSYVFSSSLSEDNHYKSYMKPFSLLILANCQLPTQTTRGQKNMKQMIH